MHETCFNCPDANEFGFPDVIVVTAVAAVVDLVRKGWDLGRI